MKLLIKFHWTILPQVVHVYYQCWRYIYLTTGAFEVSHDHDIYKAEKLSIRMSHQ